MAKDRKASESIAETYKERVFQSKTVSKDAFSKLFDELLVEYTDSDFDLGEPELSKKEVGERLGISQGMIQKIINWEKQTKCRDTVIAICMVLKADKYFVNKALYLHEMPGLDEKYPRDKAIIEIIDDYGYDPLTLDIINNRLWMKNVAPLNIPHRGKPQSEIEPLPFSILGKRVRIMDDKLYFGDINGMLCSEYHPSQYEIRAEMLIEMNKNKRQYELHAYTNGYQYSLGKGIQFEIAPIDEDGYILISKPCKKKGKLSPAFIELSDMIEAKLRECFLCVNDTKNYKERVSARIINDKRHIFCETFNYSIPELHDYYLTDYCSGEYKMYSSKDSMFMKWYLSANEYKKYYASPIKYYQVDLDRKIQRSPTSHYDEKKIGIERNIFKKQVSRIDALYQKLINGTAKIRNIECIDEIPSSAITYYGLDEMFEYTREMTEDEILLNIGKESITIPVNEEDIEITVDDVYTGFELGCEDITEIARLKQKHKSLKNIYQ